MQEKCLRRHYFKNQKGNTAPGPRVPYQSCAMTCGTSLRGVVVPIPTIKYQLGTKALDFALEDIHTHIVTPHKSVENMLREAVLVFLQDLQVLHRDAKVESSSSASTMEAKNKRSARNVEARGAEENFVSYENKCKSKHCDIDTLNIRIAVAKSDEVHLNLDADESYNLTMKGEC